MQLTRAADYAVRVMIHLATLPPDTRTNRASLAETGEVPVHFLSKILQALTRARLIHSHRGVTGGFSIQCDPEKTTLLQVVEAIEGPLHLNVCVTPGQACVRQTWCPAHRLWAEAQQAMIGVLRSATIAELGRQSAVSSASSRCALAEGEA